jgi:integrase
MVNTVFLKGKRGQRLKTPVTVDIPETQNLEEKRLQEYIMDGCLYKMPRLLPFTFENKSMMELARHLFLHNSDSQAVFVGYARRILRFSTWLGATPDEMISRCKDSEGNLVTKAVTEIERKLDEYAIHLQGKKIAPNTVNSELRSIRGLFTSNYVSLGRHWHVPAINIHDCRAPRIEELRKMLNVADLRDRLIVTILAVSGLRSGTLVKLKYLHVRKDLEKQIVPIHLRIDADITKGKYRSYSTFLNQEAVDYLRAYLDVRRMGTYSIPPETITDESPLIRAAYARAVRPLSVLELQRRIHKLFFKAGILQKKQGTIRYDLTVHGIRKFFSTQMSFLGVQREYIQYMMGHKTDRYFDAELEGIEYLRHVYKMSNISIRPQAEIGKLTILREIMHRLGLNPEEILKPETLQSSNSLQS